MLNSFMTLKSGYIRALYSECWSWNFAYLNYPHWFFSPPSLPCWFSPWPRWLGVYPPTELVNSRLSLKPSLRCHIDAATMFFFTAHSTNGATFASCESWKHENTWNLFFRHPSVTACEKIRELWAKRTANFHETKREVKLGGDNEENSCSNTKAPCSQLRKLGEKCHEMPSTCIPASSSLTQRV